MRNTDTTTPAARRLMAICCVVLAGHVLAALYFTVLPDSYLHRRRIALWYQEYLLPGPFYRADQVREAYHARIRYHSPGQLWSPYRMYADETLKVYQQQPWRYDALKQSEYAQGLFRAAYREYLRDTTQSVLQQKPAWRTLENYISDQWLPAQPMDSIQLQYYAFLCRLPDHTVAVSKMNIRYSPRSHAAP